MKVQDVISHYVTSELRGRIDRSVNATGARVAIVASMAESMPEERAEAIAQAGLVPLMGIDDALAALAAAAAAHRYAGRPPQAELALTALRAPSGVTLSEWDGKQLLRRFGVGTPPGQLVEHGQDPEPAAAALGYPVVVKAVGSQIAHKTEIGAVKLNLRTAQAVRDAATGLRGVGERLLVEAMVTDAVAELIIGVNRDGVFGLHLVIGAGGQLVELIEDSVVLLMPSSRAAIREAVLGLRAARLLQGYRNRPRGDIDAVVEAVIAVQAFALAHADRLLELDVNPLLVRPEGHGAVAVDALVRLVPEH